MLLQCFSLQRMYVFSLNHRSAVVGGIKMWEQAISYISKCSLGLSNCPVGRQRWIYPIQLWNLNFMSIQLVTVVVHWFGYSSMLVELPSFLLFLLSELLPFSLFITAAVRNHLGTVQKMNCPGSGEFFLLLCSVLPQSPELLPLHCKVDFDFLVEHTVPGMYWQSQSISGNSSSVYGNPRAASAVCLFSAFMHSPFFL